MAEDIDVQLESASGGGRYVALVEGHEAEMTYSDTGDRTMTINHTEVPKALGGRGIGKVLVRRAVEDARKAGKKIVAECPYAKAQIEKHEEWRDVLK